MAVDVTITGSGNSWNITSNGSTTVNGIISVNPPATGAWVKFALPVTKGSDPASQGPYSITLLTPFVPTQAGDCSIQAANASTGPWSTAHPISVGRGGTGSI
jgi:hypothetical protein